MRPSEQRLPLNHDILGCIMASSPDFDTLHSSLLICKIFYSAFRTRPKGITWEVAHNVVGSTLPQALRVLKYPYGDNTPESEPLAMAAASPESSIPDSITAQEKHALTENSELIQALEDIYSFTNKDRTSKTSVLTHLETLRFRRAMYRFLLYSKIFPSTAYIQFPFDDLLPHRLLKQRMAILDVYPTEELLELSSAVEFVRSMLDVAKKYSGDDLNEFLLSTGPSGALMVWNNWNYYVLEDRVDLEFVEEEVIPPGMVDYFSTPLQKVLEERNVLPQSTGSPTSKYILDQVNGENDCCSQCGAPDGLKLYCEANWHRFPSRLRNLLKVNLRSNTTIQHSFFEKALKLEYSAELGELYGDLFTLRNDTTPVFDAWKRSGSYCRRCLSRFFDEHIWIWFLNERVKEGWTPPENCPDGFDCRLQGKDRAHEEEKNHLCFPVNYVLSSN
ncbi:hypothetical protein R3P38DRAFT_2838738 [Favolaschia claudopus]|uniref:F-box domain-containing protein n=1 Tax=Favolaschia claudopus TaxID=2862362 RepID=A0AAW0EAJ7_9AGAR